MGVNKGAHTCWRSEDCAQSYGAFGPSAEMDLKT